MIGQSVDGYLQSIIGNNSQIIYENVSIFVEIYPKYGPKTDKIFFKNISLNKMDLMINYNSLTPLEKLSFLEKYSVILNLQSEPEEISPVFENELHLTLPTGFFSNNNPKNISTTKTSNQIEMERNERTTLRNEIINLAIQIKSDDIDVISKQSSLVSDLTKAVDEITRSTALSIIDYNERTLNQSITFNESSVKQLIIEKQFEIMSNINIGMNVNLNARVQRLESDYIDAITLSDDYDTDIENFWTNPNNFGTGTIIYINEMHNTLRQKYDTLYIIEKSSSLMDRIMLNKLNEMKVNEEYRIELNYLQYYIKKLKARDLPEYIPTIVGLFRIPSFCALVNQVATNQSDDCEQRIISYQTMAFPMAPCGHNGNNESFIGSSTTHSLRFFDQLNNEININNIKSNQLIETWISKDKQLKPNSFFYKFVNKTTSKPQMNNKNEPMPFMPFALFNKLQHLSLHIELRPLNYSISYVIIVSPGLTPYYNKTYANFKYAKLFCSNKSKFYLF
jgi:hypothetical protein